MSHLKQLPPEVKGRFDRTKRAVGYSSTFGVLAFFLIPGVIPATAAIVTGMVVGAVIARKTGKK